MRIKMASHSNPRSVQGFSLVEVLMASVMAVVILIAVQKFMVGSLQSFAMVSIQGKAHVEFEVLREYLARDIQHAQAVVAAVTLDGQNYQTEMDAIADTIVLRLESVDTNTQVIGGLYDFVVYQGQGIDAVLSSLTRRVFINRDVNGVQQNPEQGSTRLPGSIVLSREVLTPQANGSVPAVFVLDMPVISLVREVRLSVTLQPTESTYTDRTLPRSYTARFRLRNS